MPVPTLAGMSKGPAIDAGPFLNRGTVTETANPALGKIEDLFKDLVWDNLITAALTALFAYIPVLGVWPLKPIITYVVTTFASKLFDLVRLTVDLQVIVFANNAHKKAFDGAAVKLKIIAHSHGTSSDQFKKAKEDAKETLSAFVRFNGT